MAHNNGSNNNDREESSPLLSKQVVEGDEKKEANGKKSKEATAEVAASPAVSTAAGYGWTADGLPLGHGSVVGEPMGRAQWDSPLLACLGRNDEFCSSDVEVCLLGSMAPCVLYGSNVERLGSVPGTFANHCLPYSVLYLLVNCFLPLHVVSPSCGDGGGGEVKCSVGTCEALNRLCGCCGSCVEDEMQREQCESACDFATHVFCHACALCQEGRELRRRLPHPGFNAQPVLVMMPPGEQTMGRGA
ncbi:hypothetical protein QUC31_011157 [Theobroma cacao]